MRRTLGLGWRQGLATGFGIATADGLYASVAALGLTGVASFLLSYDRPLHISAGLMLLWLGVRTMRAHTADLPAERPRSVSWSAAYGGAMLLTLANPPTIITFAAIFTALAPPSGFEPETAAATVGGVFAGSLLWWGVIVGSVAGFRHAIGPRTRRWIDRAAGLGLAVFGMVELARAV